MKFIVVGIMGKMGSAIKKAIENNGDVLVAGVDIIEDKSKSIYKNINEINLDFDAVIDFSTAESRKEIINFCRENHKPYGCFATNLTKEDEEDVKELFNKVPVVRCNNASEGINLMYKLTEEIAQNASNADIVLNEYHHKQKIDAPSGTAKNLLQILANHNINCKTSAFRVGTEKGRHELQLFWEDECLTISHQVSSRMAFANGAVTLMHKLIDKQKETNFTL